MATAPTTTRIRLISQSPFAEQGFGDGTAVPDSLDRLVLAASTFVIEKTGWGTWEAVPDGFAPLLENAVSLLTAMYAAQSTPEYLETLSDFDLIVSFSAGSYSEQRRSPEDAMKAKMLVAWPPANAAIVAAMTPDAYADYLGWLSGLVPPAFSVTEVAWEGGTIYGDEFIRSGIRDSYHPW